MRTLFRNLFLDNWQRKTISIGIAIITWFAVNHSLTASKTISNIPVKVINLPMNKTIDGVQSKGLLTRRVTLTLLGNKPVLDELNADDLEVVVDATDKEDEWLASITKKNLVSLNPEIDLSTAISKISSLTIPVRLTKLVTEKIPILVTQPVGEPPRGYQFLDVWPYHLSMTICGPEDVVKKIKAKEQKFTLNLNDISKAQLDALQPYPNSQKGEVVSFFIPDPWKQISLPALAETPFEIDDPQARDLRIDFVHYSLLPVDKPIPVTLYFPPEYSSTLNPNSVSFATNDLVKEVNGLFLTSGHLYAKGVSRLFLQVVRDMLQIEIVVVPNSVRNSLEWSVQVINPRVLEDRYIAEIKSDVSNDELRDLQPSIREDYWRNRFRSYMNHFQLFKSCDTKLDLKIELEGNTVKINEAQ